MFVYATFGEGSKSTGCGATTGTNALMFQVTTPAAAISNGHVKIEKGDPKALERLFKIIGFHRRLPEKHHAVRKASVGERPAARNAG